MNRSPTTVKIKKMLILSLAIVLVPSCFGQDIARREGIKFKHSGMAFFKDIPPDSRLFSEALEKALEVTEVDRTELATLPRVVKGSSLFVDPTYLGKTDYMTGLVFVWEGPEIPVEDVLLHEMIHWVLYYGGFPERALDETYVLMLASAFVEDRYGPEPSPNQARWRDIDARRRNMQRHTLGIFDQDEPDSWGLARQRERTFIPNHP